MLSRLIGRKDINPNDRKELDEVKDRLTTVERRVKLVEAQVKLVRRVK